MASISVSMDDFKQLYISIIDYFSSLENDEIIAWSCIGAGFLLFVIGFMLL